MTTNGTNERLLRFLQASPEQQGIIDQVLDGRFPANPEARSGPLLMSMGAAAKFLGISRTVCWRLRKSGRLPTVEILPGSFRVRRADLEAVAAGQKAVVQ